MNMTAVQAAWIMTADSAENSSHSSETGLVMADNPEANEGTSLVCPRHGVPTKFIRDPSFGESHASTHTGFIGHAHAPVVLVPVPVVVPVLVVPVPAAPVPVRFVPEFTPDVPIPVPTDPED